MNIGQALNGRNNSFGVIRLAMAALVIASHSFTLGGFGGDPSLRWTHEQTHAGTFAVLTFLAISGYAVTKSALRADLLQFFWRRVLRIFPAFWAALLVVALVLAPVVWVISGNSLATYFTMDPEGPAGYLAGTWTLLINQWNIYDIFDSTNPFTSVNGSLWTIVYEWWCYVLIGGLAFVGALTKARVLVPTLTGLFAVFQVADIITPASVGAIMPLLADQMVIRLAFVFLCGATLALYSDRIPFSHGFGIAAVIVVLLTLREGGFYVVGVPALTYALVWLAVVLPKPFQAVGLKNDYSYALYLWGWPMQQLAAFFGWHQWGYIAYTGVSLSMAMACAWVSWHVIERPALSLKDWGPGRGLAHWGETAQRFLIRRRVLAAGAATSLAPTPALQPSRLP
jgi:peptidoglycan/LPS O-acetylase OafA/YrhL